MPEKRIPPGGEGAMDGKPGDEIVIRLERKPGAGEIFTAVIEPGENVEVLVRRRRKP